MRTTSRIPHTRGDGPSPEFVENLKGMYSPHAWGWTNIIVRLHRFKSYSPHAWGWTADHLR